MLAKFLALFFSHHFRFAKKFGGGGLPYSISSYREMCRGKVCYQPSYPVYLCTTMPHNKRGERCGEYIENNYVVEVFQNSFIVHGYIKSRKNGKWKGQKFNITMMGKGWKIRENKKGKI